MNSDVDMTIWNDLSVFLSFDEVRWDLMDSVVQCIHRNPIRVVQETCFCSLSDRTNESTNEAPIQIVVALLENNTGQLSDLLRASFHLIVRTIDHLFLFDSKTQTMKRTLIDELILDWYYRKFLDVDFLETEIADNTTRNRYKELYASIEKTDVHKKTQLDQIFNS